MLVRNQERLLRGGLLGSVGLVHVFSDRMLFARSQGIDLVDYHDDGGLSNF